MEYALPSTHATPPESAALPPRLTLTAGLRHRFDTLDGQRAEALAHDDQSTVAQCEDALIRAELLSAQMEAWRAEQAARTDRYRA